MLEEDGSRGVDTRNKKHTIRRAQTLAYEVSKRNTSGIVTEAIAEASEDDDDIKTDFEDDESPIKEDEKNSDKKKPSQYHQDNKAS